MGDRRQEGAVMLVVMLILMVATASAAVSVHTTQSELHAAGEDRLALQAAYVSEAAIMTTTAWIDLLGDSGQWLDIWDSWAGQSAPAMNMYGEPNISADPAERHHATRSVATQQIASQRAAIPEVPPVTQASGSAGSGGSGGGPSFVDTLGIGSFGPNQAYGLARDTSGTIGYVVDITDCAIASSAHAPGAPIGGGAGSLKFVQFACVLTARGRLQLPGTPTTRVWSFGAVSYNQDAFMSAHDSRATILTPEMLVPAE